MLDAKQVVPLLTVQPYVTPVRLRQTPYMPPRGGGTRTAVLLEWLLYLTPLRGGYLQWQGLLDLKH